MRRSKVWRENLGAPVGSLLPYSIIHSRTLLTRDGNCRPPFTHNVSKGPCDSMSLNNCYFLATIHTQLCPPVSPLKKGSQQPLVPRKTNFVTSIYLVRSPNKNYSSQFGACPLIWSNLYGVGRECSCRWCQGTRRVWVSKEGVEVLQCLRYLLSMFMVCLGRGFVALK